MFTFMAVYLTMSGQYKQVALLATCDSEAEKLARASLVHGLDEFQFVRVQKPQTYCNCKLGPIRDGIVDYCLRCEQKLPE